MKYFSHMNTAVQLLQQYNGSQPFGSFIKQFFSQHKKYGSKDRKHIAQLCYAWFRLGKALPKLDTGERILTGLFFCSHEPNELLQHLKPDWNEQTHLPLQEKIELVNTQQVGGSSPSVQAQADKPSVSLNEVFPWTDLLSAGLNYDLFCASFFTQPDLFLRLRPRAAPVVKSKLQQAGISFRDIGNACIALPNASKIDTVIEPDREAVIQDYSSQRIGELMEFIRDSIGGTSTFAKAPADKSKDNSPGARGSTPSTPLSIWDACAASGGKSILAYDIFNRIDLTVSDVRKSILINLEKRFAAAGIKKYQALLTDLSTSNLDIQHLPAGRQGSTFDIIITDVPCTGSGTWSRTPEQLYYFDPHQIERFSALQKKIVQHAIPHLKQGGFLLYCTCSVFKQENEEVVRFIEEQYPLQLLRKELFTGYAMKADTLFGAVFQKR
jgi:16S rRNA (cytosine967-C5)-methyltransferase